MIFPRTLFLALLLAVPPASTLAQPVPLEENKVVRDGFYIIGLADEIRKNCPRIGPRLVRAYAMLKGLESYARDNGYTEQDVKDLEDNDAVKDALRAEIRRDLAARGASGGNTAGYCKVGRDEIARNTPAGRLLKEN